MSETITETVKEPTGSRGQIGRWKGNHYLPTTPVLRKDEEKKDFLKILKDCNGKVTQAAALYKISSRTVSYVRQADQEFDRAVLEIREAYRQKLVDSLEDVSEKEAIKPNNTTERIFLLNANEPDKYRPRANTQVNTQIVVTTTSPTIESRGDPYKEVKNE